MANNKDMIVPENPQASFLSCREGKNHFYNYDSSDGIHYCLFCGKKKII